MIAWAVAGRWQGEMGGRRAGHFAVTTQIPSACNNACGVVGRGVVRRREARAAFAVGLAVAAGLLGAFSVSAAGSRGHTTLPVHGVCANTTLRPTQANLARVASATLCLIERERETYHLGLLRSDSSLQHIAAGQARAMVVGDYFGDNTPSGGTPWQRITASPYGSRAHGLAAAQNIGWGTQEMATPAGMVTIWMNSPPHREIMLTGGYRDVGVGVAPAAPSSLTGGEPGATYTVEFAARK
jgi:uncharacterized protein YkwD